MFQDRNSGDTEMATLNTRQLFPSTVRIKCTRRSPLMLELIPPLAAVVRRTNYRNGIVKKCKSGAELNNAPAHTNGRYRRVQSRTIQKQKGPDVDSGPSPDSRCTQPVSCIWRLATPVRTFRYRDDNMEEKRRGCE